MQTLQIKNLGKIITGKTPITSNRSFFDGQFPFVTPSDITFQNYYCRKTEITVTETAKQKYRSQFIPSGSVLVTCIGSTIGKCALSSEECLTNQQINSIVPFDTYASKYVYYLMIYNIEIIRGIGLSGGVAAPIINKTSFEKIKIKILPKDSRDSVGDILSIYDDLIDTNRRRIQLLEEAARLLFREWFVYFRFPSYAKASEGTPGHEKIKVEDGMPIGWEREKLSKYVVFKRGVEPGTDNYLESQEIDTFPFYRVSDLITRKPEIFIDELYTKGALLEKKDIVISLDGSVGIVSMGLEGCYSTGIRKLVIKGKRINRPFLYCLMKSYYIQGVISAYSKGTTIQHAGEFIKYMNPILPPQSLMDKFEEVVDPVLNEILTLLDQNQKLSQARDLLLPRLMSGKIDPVRYDKLSNGDEV